MVRRRKYTAFAMQEVSRLRFDIQRLEGLNFMKIQLKYSNAKGICFYSPVPKYIDFVWPIIRTFRQP